MRRGQCRTPSPSKGKTETKFGDVHVEIFDSNDGFGENLNRRKYISKAISLLLRKVFLSSSVLEYDIYLQRPKFQIHLDIFKGCFCPHPQWTLTSYGDLKYFQRKEYKNLCDFVQLYF